MLRRLGWIAASFFTRPLCLVLCAAGVLISGLVWMADTGRMVREAIYPPMPRPRLLVDSVASLEAVRESGRQGEVDGINLNYLWADMEQKRLHVVPGTAPREIKGFTLPGVDFFRIVREFPNLEWVQLSLYGEMQAAEEIARLPKLKSLSVDGTTPGDTADLAWLEPAHGLEYLEVRFYRPLRGLDALAAVPVETLVLRSSLEVDPQVLAETAELGRLKTLVLAFLPSAVDGPKLDEQAFAALENSKSLETLYIDGATPEKTRGLLTAALRGGPRLDVRPALVAQPTPLVLFTLYPAGMVAAAIGLALSFWFRGPTSRLAPRFFEAHLALAALLAIGVIGMATWRVIGMGFQPLAALIVASAVVTTTISVASGGTVEAQRMRQQRGSRWLVGAKQLLIYALLAAVIVPGFGVRLLEGEYPAVLAALAAMTAVTPVLTLLTLRSLVDAAPVTTAARRPFESSRTLLNTRFRPGWMFATGTYEQLIDAWASEPPEWTWWNRVRRWRVGNQPLRSARMVLLVLPVALPAIWLFLRLFSPRAMEFDMVKGQFLMVAAVLAMVVPLRVAAIWRQRVMSLPLDSLRPGGTRQMLGEMAAGLVIDLVPAVTLISLIEAIGLNVDSSWHVAWGRVPGHFAVLLACLLPLATALAATTVVIQRELVAAAMALALPMVMGLALAALIAVGGSPGRAMRTDALQLIVPQMWIVGLLGTIYCAVMCRRWLRLEVGSRAG